MLPVIAVQGLMTSRRMEVLPEAGGPSTGFTTSTQGPPVRLLVVGESTAAGVGAATHEEAFTGALARALEERHGRQVRWTVHGENGARVRRLRHHVLPNLDVEADVAVLLVGVNDVMARTPVEDWRTDLAAVLDELATQAGRVVVTGVPRFAAFPSLPRALAADLDQRGRVLDDVARQLCAERADTVWIESPALDPAEGGLFARDGFHPSPAGYEHWARLVDERIA